MILNRSTPVGFNVEIFKSTFQHCIDCKYKRKLLFREKYKCKIIRGLYLDDGKYGFCTLYDKETDNE